MDELFILPPDEYNYTLEDIDIIQDDWVCTIREWLKFTSEEVLHSTLTDEEIDNMSHEELNELIEELDWLQWS